MKNQKGPNEGKKRRQAKASGLLVFIGHRSHTPGQLGLRSWSAKMHKREMAALKKRFEVGDKDVVYNSK